MLRLYKIYGSQFPRLIRSGYRRTEQSSLPPESGDNVSDVKWCDIGEHPFPANQPGATTMTMSQQIPNQWGGYQPSGVVMDICSACATDSGMRRMSDEPGESQEKTDAKARDIRRRSGGRTVLKTLGRQEGRGVSDPEEARARGYDPDYVAWLEKQTHDLTELEERDYRE